MIRRSPLASVHSRLGARWVDPAMLWPADYGDPAREVSTARSTAGLADIGPVGKFELRGPGAAPVISAAKGVFRPGTVTGDRSKGESQVWGMAPDHALVVRTGSQDLTARPVPGVAIVDLSSALSVFRLVGPNTRALLSELCSIDLDPGLFSDCALAHIPLANVRVTLARLDWGGMPGYTILLARDYAEYMWEALMDVGGSHGLGAVGGRSIGEAPAS